MTRWQSSAKRKLLLLPLVPLLTFLCLNIPTGMTPAAKAGAAMVALANGGPSPLVARSQLVGDSDAQGSLSMQVVLPLRNEAALQQYVRLLSTPSSVLYHRYLRPAAFSALYGPTTQDIATVSQYLQTKGFHITSVAAGRQVIDFSGTVAQAQQAFGVHIKQYRTKSGHIFYTNDTAPRVPQAIRPLIQSIGGLSDAVQRQTHITRPRAVSRVSPHTSCISAGDSTNTSYYTPGQLASAYNFNTLYTAGYHGEGQSVALFELDGYLNGDISGYRSCFDASSPTRVSTTMIDNGPGSLGGGSLEVELDMDVLLGMLPKLANLFVYEAPNTNVGYNDEWARILNDTIPVVSISWGTCEANLTGGDITTEQQFFTQAAAQGQSILAASGDSGSYDCGDSSLSTDDPGSNPYVTAVGGTTLQMGSNATYSSETGWSGSVDGHTGSGGGISQLWTMPNYQAGPGVVNGSSSGLPCSAPLGTKCREVPDVSLNADPNVGYVVYCTVSAAGCDGGSFWVVGGTSAAAPMWAALTVLANQYSLAHGGTNLGFLNPALYEMLQNSGKYSSAFHDISTSTDLYYSAAANYDLVTGIGSFNAANIVQQFVPSQVVRNVPGNTSWYFAEGHLGNHFQEYVTLENPSVSSAAHVTINYLLRGLAPRSQSLILNASTRTTVNVNTVIGVDRLAMVGQDVSLAITSDLAVIAERPIYFTFGGVTPGGSDIIGTTQPGLHFTFANGTTQTGYNTFLAILNPISQPTASVTATYYSGGVAIGHTTISAPAGQRSTIPVNGVLAPGKQFLIQVDSDQPVVVERPLYFHLTVAGISGTVIGGGSVPGVVPTTNWYFPAGDTGIQGGSSKEYLLLANPSDTSANVSILYALGTGITSTVTLSIPAKSQVIRSVNGDVGNNQLVAAQVTVTNSVDIVVERQQFFRNTALTPNPTAVEVLGLLTATAGPSGLSSVYSFAEGHVGSSFSQYTSLFNPNNSAIVVSLTYFIANGSGHAITQQQLTLPALGVMRVSTNSFLNVPNSASSASGVATDVSLVVQSLTTSGPNTLPLVAERSLYFNFVGTTPGSTSLVGYNGN